MNWIPEWAVVKTVVGRSPYSPPLAFLSLVSWIELLTLRKLITYCVRDMMHAQVKPDNQIRLVQALPVEKVIKVDRRVVGVLVVVPVHAMRLCILSL
jgi:hypothetical protein